MHNVMVDPRMEPVGLSNSNTCYYSFFPCCQPNDSYGTMQIRTYLCKGNGLDSTGGIAAGGGVTLYRWLGTQSGQIYAHD